MCVHICNHSLMYIANIMMALYKNLARNNYLKNKRQQNMWIRTKHYSTHLFER